MDVYHLWIEKKNGFVYPLEFNLFTVPMNMFAIMSFILKDSLLCLLLKYLIKNFDVQWRLQHCTDKTIKGATQFIKSGKVKAKKVMFQISSNDLYTKEADEVIYKLCWWLVFHIIEFHKRKHILLIFLAQTSVRWN